MAAYSFLDRLLHRLALQIGPVAELSFDLDQRMVRSDPARLSGERHVFISGLARAGTTALMRRFHATGAYRSLTYRDMPFVLAPNLWRRAVGRAGREAAPAERAHGDRILVDLDSPESLDEVFWRIFAGPDYIRPDSLVPHCPDPETVQKFVRYVGAVLHSGEPSAARRYLSKNNNNILRLGTLRQAFPRALILIPFREPVAHAASLGRQHRNFLRMQDEDPFVRSYMTWLAHHEFGHDHRPFRFGDEPPAPASGPDGPDHWLALWTATYGWLERTAPAEAVFVCYEELCGDPGVWSRLAGMAGVDAEAGGGEAFRAGAAAADDGENSSLVPQARQLYARLKERAHAALAGRK